MCFSIFLALAPTSTTTRSLGSSLSKSASDSTPEAMSDSKHGVRLFGTTVVFVLLHHAASWDNPQPLLYELTQAAGDYPDLGRPKPAHKTSSSQNFSPLSRQPLVRHRHFGAQLLGKQ